MSKQYEKCPECSSENLEELGIESCKGSAWREVMCGRCEFKWQEEFKFHHSEDMCERELNKDGDPISFLAIDGSYWTAEYWQGDIRIVAKSEWDVHEIKYEDYEFHTTRSYGYDTIESLLEVMSQNAPIISWTFIH